MQLELADGTAHTKIEFSRRGLSDGVEFGPVDRGLLGGYGLSPMLLSHYGRQDAVEQKLAALVGRNETQARDVFDLDLLLSVQRELDPSAIDEKLSAAAVDCALAVDYRTFKAQVVAFSGFRAAARTRPVKPGSNSCCTSSTRCRCGREPRLCAARLRELGVATFTTNDVAAALRIDGNHARQVLQRLARTQQLVRLARGRWALPERVQPFMLPEALTAPRPSYVSLYSALHHHGLIEEVPDVVYAITLAPTRRIDTPLGTVSLHQVAPEFFFDCKVEPKTGVKIATAEKALLDVLYLRQARSHAFRALPELELPASFDIKRAHAIARKISSAPRRKFVAKQLESTLSQAR